MFWKNKRVLITGHTGFKGSWLCLWLEHLGADVTGFSLPPPTSPNLFTIADVAQGITSVIGDIRNFNELQSVVNEHNPDIVIHMAAQPLVRYSYREPVETYATNVMGTVNLLEAVRQNGNVRAVVNVTTDKCYENREWQWGYRENDTLGGHDPYSNSKACSELVTSAYRKSFFARVEDKQQIGLASARAGNVIGGGDWAEDRLIPDIFRSFVENKAVEIRNPEATRPWQHVLEPLSGYLLLAQKLYESPSSYAEGWNFGPDESDVKPVKWIADYLVSAWPEPASWNHNRQPQPHEANFLRLECDKAKERLGWTPHWDLKKGLTETVNWYKAYRDRKNMREVTISQILDFMNTNQNQF